MDEKSGHNNNIQFKRPLHHQAEPMKEILWRLATKQLRPTDWKKLAKHWKFTEDHIKAIEHQYTGNGGCTEDHIKAIEHQYTGNGRFTEDHIKAMAQQYTGNGGCCEDHIKAIEHRAHVMADLLGTTSRP